MVISIPQTILSEIEISEGDRVLIESVTRNRLVITKEIQNMTNTRRAELELALLRSAESRAGIG